MEFDFNSVIVIYELLQKKMETEFSGLLNIAERTSGLYFSYETNLTLSSAFFSTLVAFFHS